MWAILLLPFSLQGEEGDSGKPGKVGSQVKVSRYTSFSLFGLAWIQELCAFSIAVYCNHSKARGKFSNLCLLKATHMKGWRINGSLETELPLVVMLCVSRLVTCAAVVFYEIIVMVTVWHRNK